MTTPIRGVGSAISAVTACVGGAHGNCPVSGLGLSPVPGETRDEVLALTWPHSEGRITPISVGVVVVDWRSARWQSGRFDE